MSAPARIGLFKRLWDTMPEVVGSSFMGVIGLGLGAYGVYNYYQNDGDNRRYKFEYTVYRHDDPRVPKLKN